METLSVNLTEEEINILLDILSVNIDWTTSLYKKDWPPDDVIQTYLKKERIIKKINKCRQMKLSTYKGLITKLSENEVFVFGSNTQGRHGAGAALYAVRFFGAIYGKARGIQGQSYAICTKDLTKRDHPSISAKAIMGEILSLYRIATQNGWKKYYVAYSMEPNLNGYTPAEMAQMFYHKNIPSNIIFEENFAKLIEALDDTSKIKTS